jgi:hypothetical protein
MAAVRRVKKSALDRVVGDEEERCAGRRADQRRADAAVDAVEAAGAQEVARPRL